MLSAHPCQLPCSPWSSCEPCFVLVQLLSYLSQLLSLTLCNPMDCSIPGFPVLHSLLEFPQTHVLLSQYHPTISSSVIPSSSCLQSFSASGSFPMSQFFALGGQSIGASASASVLPMSIQSWFPLGLTVWSSCLQETCLQDLSWSSRDSQESSSAPQFKSNNSLVLSLNIVLKKYLVGFSKVNNGCFQVMELIFFLWSF